MRWPSPAARSSPAQQLHLTNKDTAARLSFPALESMDGTDPALPRQRPDTPMRILDPQSLSQHVDRLYRAAWALCGSRDDAEDLVQETFARVLVATTRAAR